MRHHTNKTIAFTGGGTGGHVYPALPLIKKLKQEKYNLCWIGSRKGMEKDIVGKWDITYYPVATGKLRRYFSFQNFTDIFRIIAGFFQSYFYLLKIKPALLFSKGGFVSVPPVAAAALLGIPVLTHDSDVDPGLATKINSRFARKIFVPYEKSLNFFSQQMQQKVIVSGNPVREEFFSGSEILPENWDKLIGNRKLIVVIGGSLGAVALNQLITDCLGELTKEYFVVHQMGDRNYSPSEWENYLPVPYINEELPALFRRADLVISRAGAGTLWELAATSTPSLLLPLKAGSRGDQIKNAEIFAEAGCARILDDDITPDSLIGAVRDILNNTELQADMKKAAGFFTAIPADAIILEQIHREEKQ